MIESNEPGAEPATIAFAARAATAATEDAADRLGAELARLRQEHRDLDAAIVALGEAGSVDLLQLQRLKKRKLLLKDRIRRLQDELTPDIIA
ncbi:hypothetical protein GCM10019059_18990 [Camelimonas fluminis]|nr:hypothetical protein GCM10019059_18990 [Camelimonas fluminis]